MPDFLVKTLAVVVLLGGLIFVHELGHFLVAKLLRVKVVRFSIGFGPRLAGFQWGETEYRISAVFLGGYVKMAGEDPTAELAPEDRGRGFLEQAPWRRLLIAAAGPLFNLGIPFLLLAGILLARNGTPTAAPVLGTIIAGSPAEKAGLQADDRILAVTAPGAARQALRQFTDLTAVVVDHPREQLTLEVERAGKALPPVQVVTGLVEGFNGVETVRRGVLGVVAEYQAARLVPAVPGAAGPLAPFDLVVAVDGAPVRHAVELQRALEAARCRPVALEVLRERARPVPGAVLAAVDRLGLADVPTCRDGQPTWLPADLYTTAAVPGVEPGGPAEQAGLRRGDVITAINATPVRNLLDVNTVVGREFAAGKPGTVTLADGRTLTLVPVEERSVDELTGKEQRHATVGITAPLAAGGAGGVASDAARRVPQVAMQHTLGEIAADSAQALVDLIRTMVLGLLMMFSGKISLDQVGGPIQIIKMTAEAVDQGVGVFVRFMALISVNLGVMNLLPIPVLDGGHIVQALLETITRRPLSLRAREVANIVGLVLLISLMAFAFKNDIVRHFQGR